MVRWTFFFFQAEDGIRDHCVTGVQTCALPISRAAMVDDGLRHRAHDAVRHERRPGDLEEGPSGRRRHVAKSSMAVRAAGRRAAEASGEMVEMLECPSP